LNTILDLKRRADRVHVTGSRLYNPGWHTARDLRFMLLVSEAIVRGAIERRESRGAHWRTDFPNADPNFGKLNLVALKDGDAMRITTRSVPEMPDELADLFNGKVRQKTA
jgi:succinate dehydrogenase / fumarate reductase flavoprotein subunit